MPSLLREGAQRHSSCYATSVSPTGRPGAPILYVHHAGRNWVRGATRCLLDLLSHMDRSRFEPVVWCNQPVIRDAVRELGVTVHAARDWGPFHPLRPDRRWIRETLDLIRSHGIRLIHADEFTQASILVPAARFARVPLLVQLHQVPTPDERLWSLLHQVDLTVGTSRACLTGLLADGYPASRALVVYNGVDPARLSKGDATGLRPSLGIAPSAVVFSLVASLLPAKAVDVALRALALVCAAASSRGESCSIHLLVCGSGPERAALEQLATSLGIGGAVTFLGECQHVGAIMRDATDVLLAPSRDESFGLTLAEAGFFGVPAVVSDIPAHLEVVGDQAGVIVPVDDVSAFAEAMKRVAGDPLLRRRLGDAARERTTAMFLIDRYVREFEATYAGLLAQPKSAFGLLHGVRWPRAYNTWVHDAISRRWGQVVHPRPDPSRVRKAADLRGEHCTKE